MIADPLRRSSQQASAMPVFAAPYAPADEDIAAELLPQASLGPSVEARIDGRAAKLVGAVRARAGGLGGIEDFLHEYSLSTREGLALMVLAEALLRVPDAVTADRLIEDKLAAGDWSHHEMKSHALLVSASAWALGISARIIHPGETPEGIIDNLARRLGLPALRAAVRQAMRLLGSHFVLGQTIEDALARAAARPAFRYSFDMLGEGARTAADAERYFEAYAHAIAIIGAGADRPDQLGGAPIDPRFHGRTQRRLRQEFGREVLVGRRIGCRKDRHRGCLLGRAPQRVCDHCEPPARSQMRCTRIGGRALFTLPSPPRRVSRANCCGNLPRKNSPSMRLACEKQPGARTARRLVCGTCSRHGYCSF